MCEMICEKENLSPVRIDSGALKSSSRDLERLTVKRKRSSVESADDDSVSRKEKSLGLLCQRFLTAMGEESRKGNEIHLETVARKMAMEKRRIYDIVNVMEALDAMTKSNKSFYRWDGLTLLPRLIAQLQKEGIEQGLPKRISEIERAMCSFTELSTTKLHPPTDEISSSRSMSSEIVGTLVTDKDNDNDSGYFDRSLEQISNKMKRRPMVSRVFANRDRDGRNSLAQLCRRFLTVLLCAPDSKRRVSLDVASTILIKDPYTEGFEPPSRSRCRRLYDIANVLVAMGLIKKVHYLFGTKKIPLFVYSGPEPDEKGELAATDRDTLIRSAKEGRVGRDMGPDEKKLALANACSAPASSRAAESGTRTASLMDICEIAAIERQRLLEAKKTKDDIMAEASNCARIQQLSNRSNDNWQPDRKALVAVPKAIRGAGLYLNSKSQNDCTNSSQRSTEKKSTDPTRIRSGTSVFTPFPQHKIEHRFGPNEECSRLNRQTVDMRHNRHHLFSLLYNSSVPHFLNIHHPFAIARPAAHYHIGMPNSPGSTIAASARRPILVLDNDIHQQPINLVRPRKPTVTVVDDPLKCRFLNARGNGK